MSALPKNTPIYFRKCVQTEETPANALYVSFKATLPSAEAHEILYSGERWIVGRHQFHTTDEAMLEAAARFNLEIVMATKANPKNPEKALGISVSTLRKRMKFVQQHLCHPTAN